MKFFTLQKFLGDMVCTDHPLLEPLRSGVQQSDEVQRSQQSRVGVGEREEGEGSHYHLYHYMLVVAKPKGRQLSLKIV